MKKRLISLCLCIFLLIALLPTGALAAGAHSITLSADTISATNGPSPCGSVTLSANSAEANTTVTVTVTANATHTVADVEATYTDGEGVPQLIKPADNKDGTWSFTMPDYDVVVNVAFSALPNTMTLGGEDKFVTLGYATPPTLTVTGAPEGASFIWYRGEDLTDKSAIIDGADGSSYTVPTGLDAGAHKYTAYVSAANYEAAQWVFTVTVSPVSEISVGDIPDPVNEGDPYVAPVIVGDGAPIDVEVQVDTTDPNAPSAELTWPVGSGSVAVQVSAVDSNTAELSATFTLPDASPHTVDADASAALLAALDGAVPVANTVFAAANNTSPIPEAAAPALVFEAPEGVATAAVTLDDSLVTGLAARDISVAARTGDHRISLGGDSLSAVAANPSYAGRSLVMAVAADNTLTSGIFTGVTGAELIPDSGVEFTLEAVDPSGTNPPVTIPGGIDIALTLPSGTDTERFNETGGLVHQTDSGTEVIPADIGSSFAGASVDLSGYDFTKVNGKWHNSISGEAGRLCFRSGSNGETLTFYCDADGYVRRGWTNGFLFQQTPPTQAATWRYVRADGVETNGIAIVDGQTYWFSDGNIHSGRMFTIGGESFCTDGAGTLREGLIAMGHISFYALANFRLHSGNSWYKIGESYYQFAGLAVIDRQDDEPSVWHDIPTVQPVVYASISSCSPVAAAYLSWQDAADTDWYDDAGAETTDFTIYTAAQLAGLAKLVNGGNNFAGKTVTLGDNIDLSGANWTPIGDAENRPFQGTFDGKGKSVENLTIATDSGCYAGLFGYVRDALIEDLSVGGSIDFQQELNDNAFAGGVAGAAISTHIENCASNVDITLIGKGNVDYYAGGIVGKLVGEVVYDKTIVGCSNSGDISVTTTGATGWTLAGGIVGRVHNDRVYNCFNTGDVSVTVTGNSEPYAGGIAGLINESGGTAYIANCYSVADVMCDDSRSVSPSGAGAMYNCYSYSNAAEAGVYYDGYSSGSGELTAAEVKALAGTLNDWVTTQTGIALGDGETPFAPWYVSSVYNGGYPCFTQYIPPLPPPEEKPKEEPIAFEDVTEDDWFFEAVQFAAREKLMEGTGTAIFDPLLPTTRGMLATIFWRLEGKPEPASELSFADVDRDAYYCDAIRWAAEVKLVEGHDSTTYGPEDDITREQLAALFHRYAAFKGLDAAERDDLSAFTDRPSGWALEDVSWAVAEKLLEGRGGGILDPLNKALRCEVAAVFFRFCSAQEKT